MVPTATIIALLVNPTSPTLAEAQSRNLQAAARTLGLEIHLLHASTDRDFDIVFATLVRMRVGALMIGIDTYFRGRFEQLAALTVRYAVPPIYINREFVAAGRYSDGVLNCAAPEKRDAVHRNIFPAVL